MRAYLGRRAWMWTMIACAVLMILAGATLAVEMSNGEVLYHQDFADVDAPYKAGVSFGSATVGNAWLDVEDDDLGIHTADDRRAYVLLPDISWTDSHTIEFSFRFTDVAVSNGYLAFLLTCWGDEPSNISAAIFRANGTIDDFDEPDDSIKKKIQNGETVYVQIPVKNGIVHTITLTAGENTCTVQRDSVLRIAEGKRGFSIRNASVAVDEVYIVNGTGYTAKNGTFVNDSWSGTDMAKDLVGNLVEHAPPTGESWETIGIFLLSVWVMVWAKRQKKRT